MALSPSKRPLTVEQFNRMIESGIIPEQDRVELIEGDLVEMAPIGARHAAGVARVVDVFRTLPPGSAILLVQSPIELTPITRLEPDVALVRRRPDFYGARLPRPEDVLLAVEVADTSLESDRAVKIPAYARAGVRETWLVDSVAGRLELYRAPGPQDYREHWVAGPDEVVSLVALPDVRVSARAIAGPST